MNFISIHASTKTRNPLSYTQKGDKCMYNYHDWLILV